MDEIVHTVLKFAAAHRAVTDSQLAVVVGGETPSAQGSVTRLIGEGLLSRRRVTESDSGCLVITETGLAAIESRLPMAGWEMQGLRRALAAGWTGKSTVLTGVAPAHQDAGQRMIVTSTAALAAQRLADDLVGAGVTPTTHSTVALHHAITDGRVVLDPATTTIHDEAALASTRELSQLLQAAENSGARLILVGDPRQSHAVNAGGLLPNIEVTAHAHQAHVQLTHNLRAHDPNDARDQHHFRTGEHQTALDGYDTRERLHLRDTQPAAEDAALDADHQDRRAGRRTLVIAQTSNDHLDELNARAQPIRHQDHQLGVDSIPLTGRPYELHAGDEIQLRASIPHPDHGTLRNRTTATITSLDPGDETAALALTDGREVTLTREQLNYAQARPAYVRHPFPAQGTTTDTTHLIIAEHPTQEGTYVALTRARQQTHLYAAADQLAPNTPHPTARRTRQQYRPRHPIHCPPTRPRTPHPEQPPTRHQDPGQRRGIRPASQHGRPPPPASRTASPDIHRRPDPTRPRHPKRSADRT